jgi:diguanylate cyclase (GGDEF)-like protein
LSNPLDRLTWLPTRALFEARLARAATGARPPGAKLALLLIDLDRLERVNETLGREIGDRVVREAVVRMTRSLPASAMLARLESDNFAALIEAGNLAEAVDQACGLIEQCRVPHVIDCLSITVTASVGISLYPSHAEDGAALMAQAERALFEAKVRGRDCCYPGGPTYCGGTGLRLRTVRG